MESRTPGAPRWMRPAYVVAGLLALGVGVAGVFLPLVPTVGPLLIAAWCFARSSERLYAWLIGHPRLGRIIAPFRSGVAMPRRTKAWVAAVMAASFAISGTLLLDGTLPRIILGVVALAAFVAVWRVPTVPRSSALETPSSE